MSEQSAINLSTMSKVELYALELQVNAHIRTGRIQKVLETLANLSEKTFNIRRYEADLVDGLRTKNSFHIDEALIVLELLLNIDSE